MTVVVQLFAVARERVGRPSVSVEVPDGGTVADLRRALAADQPALAPLLPSIMVAVAGDYATEDRPIGPGDEVALIPPVSGGSTSATR